ncbi:hypothetical protein GSI_01859 [Ganoderma sinense ZZ0214-1]|uniref:Uncharacterized protein n=1 Tax=Ganoderma sinense ZZ0214-1 TaxID=1077348 RepID=A0A2G8SRJ7_9APHY|nr:hypothetical protein GSI_01859 [Ganoderma sinense ZZ0214-1]
MSTTTSASASSERDLTVHQKSLADNCFDEGQYEAAIDALDQIRSRKNKPHDAHIRQLLYIVLYPPPSLEDQIEEEAMRLEPGSPSKLLSRRHKSSLAPSPKAAAAAQDLLMKFARTNTPESLVCALPSYPDSPNANLNDPAGSEDSHIAREALRIRNARSCWDIIREGFIPRGNGDVTASPRKPKGRRSRRAQVQDDADEGWEGEDTAAPAPVSDHAWSVLGWILTLFESNEAAVERNGQVRYSPLLLRQIPPSRPETAPRWDVRMPLDVAFHALEQERELQRSLGVRLLVLLINLTSTTFVDFSMFLNTVSTRISSLSLDALVYLFAALPLTRTIAQFKVMLCRQALGVKQAASGTGPKPQARARAQPRRRTQTDSTADAGAEEAAAPSASTSAPPSAPTQDGAGVSGFTYPTISPAELLGLLARPGKGDRTSALPTICLKCELVTSYGWVQQEFGENDRDAGWEGVVRDGSLARAVEGVFDTNTGRRSAPTDAQSKEFIRTKRDALLAIVSMW